MSDTAIYTDALTVFAACAILMALLTAVYIIYVLNTSLVEVLVASIVYCFVMLVLLTVMLLASQLIVSERLLKEIDRDKERYTQQNE